MNYQNVYFLLTVGGVTSSTEQFRSPNVVAPTDGDPIPPFPPPKPPSDVVSSPNVIPSAGQPLAMASTSRAATHHYHAPFPYASMNHAAHAMQNRASESNHHHHHHHHHHHNSSPVTGTGNFNHHSFTAPPPPPPYPGPSPTPTPAPSGTVSANALQPTAAQPCKPQAGQPYSPANKPPSQQPAVGAPRTAGSANNVALSSPLLVNLLQNDGSTGVSTPAVNSGTVYIHCILRTIRRTLCWAIGNTLISIQQKWKGGQSGTYLRLTIGIVGSAGERRKT